MNDNIDFDMSCFQSFVAFDNVMLDISELCT